MKPILLVHDNADARELLASELAAALGVPVNVVPFSSYEPALAIAAPKAFGFAVLGAAAPAIEGEDPATLEHTPLKAALDTLAEACSAFVVLTTEDDDRLDRAVAVHSSGALLQFGAGPEWLETLQHRVRAAFGLEKPAPEARRTHAVLEIVVTNRSHGLWRIERRGRVQGSRDGPLELDPVAVGDLCAKSEGLLQQLEKSDWGTCLPPVANDLHRLIFPGNQKLQAAFHEMLTEVKDLDKLRVVFSLPGDQYAWPVEAFKRYEEASNEQLWYGLHAAILRHYEGAGPLEPLFWDVDSRRVPLDCLLVGADPRAGQGLEALEQVEYEVLDIAEALRNRKALGANIGHVEPLLLGDGKAGAPKRRLLDELARRDRQYKVVHFAGHARIRPGVGDRAPTGELVLSPAEDSAIDFAALARGLGQVQFLFVSSCRSANPGFLKEAIRQSIPAVLGYRWPVNDVHARELAKAFYSALFTPTGPAYRSLGRALSQARMTAFRSFPDHVTWASPVLLAKGSAQARIETMAGRPPEDLHAGASA